jgi:hypothetical protein
MTRRKAKVALKVVKEKLRKAFNDEVYANPKVLRLGDKITELCGERDALLVQLDAGVKSRMAPLVKKERRLVEFLAGIGDGKAAKKSGAGRRAGFGNILFGQAVEGSKRLGDNGNTKERPR